MPDITGFEVSARDGNIGKIEEVVRLDDGRTYLVVDSGFWIFEKKRTAARVSTRADRHPAIPRKSRGVAGSHCVGQSIADNR